jgi:hypothetical protein
MQSCSFSNILKQSQLSDYLCAVRLLTLFPLLLLMLYGLGQNQHGMVYDNYGGYNTLQHNPANLGDSRFKYHMNVLGFNAALHNNYLQVEAPHSLYKFLYFTPDSNFGQQNFDYPFKEHYVTERLNGNDKYVFANTKVNVFSAMFSLNDRSGISLGFTNRSIVSATNISQNTIKTFQKYLDTTATYKQHQRELLNTPISMPNASISALAYQQFSVKYSWVAQDKRKDFLKVGVGIDYNLGLFGGYLKSNELDYTITGIDTMNISNADLELAYINESFYTDPSWRLNDMWGSSRLGRGAGINIGFVYEKRNDYKKYKYKMNRKTHYDRSENKYDWKVQASITDLGFIRFNNLDYAEKYEIELGADTLNWNDFDQASSWTNSDKVDTFTNSFFRSVRRDNRFTMVTPAALHLGGEYKLPNNFYIAANYTQSLLMNNSSGARMPSVLFVAPRYERKWFTATLPIAVSRYYNIVNLGAYVRAGIFYLGTDNLGGIFTGRKTNGYHLYAGFNWPIHFNRLEDADGDGISDDMDECPNFAGTRYTKGCPDSDGDKVRDSEDECPNEPGSKRTNGCPDEDDDGLIGAADKCPDAYGSKANEGCPDTDADGVHDGIDKCPENAGEERFKGCPEELYVQDKKETPNTKEIEDKDNSEKDNLTEKEEPTQEEPSKFDAWDFDTYAYWPVLGAYNELRWAEELEKRLIDKLNVQVTIKTIPGVSNYYVTLGQASTKQEAIEIQKILDRPEVNKELNGSLWWKKVLK